MDSIHKENGWTAGWDYSRRDDHCILYTKRWSKYWTIWQCLSRISAATLCLRYFQSSRGRTYGSSIPPSPWSGRPDGFSGANTSRFQVGNDRGDGFLLRSFQYFSQGWRAIWTRVQLSQILSRDASSRRALEITEKLSNFKNKRGETAPQRCLEIERHYDGRRRRFSLYKTNWIFLG